MTKRLIFLAFANNPTRKQLFSLEDERLNIIEHLQNLQVKNQLNYIDYYQYSTNKLFDSINKRCDQITVFHFGGHAGSRFGSDNDEMSIVLSDEVQNGKGLVNIYLKKCPNLKLIFINGCATRGFVKLIRKAGIEAAIIATEASIEDRRAQQFARQFYEAFTRENTKLVDAFKMAYGSLQHGLSLEPVVMRNAGFEESESEAMPWTLFVTDSVPEDWILSPEVKQPSILGEEIVSIQKQILELHTRKYNCIQQPNEDIKRLEDRRDTYQNDIDTYYDKLGFEEFIDDRKIKLRETEQKIEQKLLKSQQLRNEEVEKLESKIQKLVFELEAKSKNKFSQALEDILRNQLKKINFGKQISDFDQHSNIHFAESPFQVFLLMGSMFCGHELLLERLIVRSTVNPFKIKVDFRTKGNAKSISAIDIPSTIQEIWNVIGIGLKVGDAKKDIDPLAILRDIGVINQAMNDIIVVFRNENIVSEQQLRLIRDFLLDFQEKLQFAKIKLNSSHKVYFYVLDKSRNNKFLNPDCSLESKRFEGHLKNADSIAPHCHLLTPITPVSKEILEDWIDRIDFPTREFKNKLKVNKDNSFRYPVFCTIESICEDLNKNILFEEILSGLFPPIPLEERSMISKKVLASLVEGKHEIYPL